MLDLNPSARVLALLRELGLGVVPRAIVITIPLHSACDRSALAFREKLVAVKDGNGNVILRKRICVAGATR